MVSGGSNSLDRASGTQVLRPRAGVLARRANSFLGSSRGCAFGPREPDRPAGTAAPSAAPTATARCDLPCQQRGHPRALRGSRNVSSKRSALLRRQCRGRHQLHAHTHAHARARSPAPRPPPPLAGRCAATRSATERPVGFILQLLARVTGSARPAERGWTEDPIASSGQGALPLA